MIWQNPCSYPRLELKKTASCHHPSLNMETPVPLLFSSLVLLVKQTMDLGDTALLPFKTVKLLMETEAKKKSNSN
ncbi:hypothetical protein Tco_1284537 [Tanacetum coccineum]